MALCLDMGISLLLRLLKLRREDLTVPISSYGFYRSTFHSSLAHSIDPVRHSEMAISLNMHAMNSKNSEKTA
jgi:hypothetical protein